ncbi:lipase family protein [Azorhizobium oxalatiphilum]|nr:hypothetical protein [Azorhizobium oxalatiphilum]
MLSLASNILFGQKGSQAELTKQIQEYVGVPGGAQGTFFGLLNTPSPDYQCLTAPTAGGTPDWKVAWGPAVFEAPLNKGATNTMFAAYSAGLKTYVVAIAGTNPIGFNALLFQDLDVNPAHMKAWPPAQNAQDPTKLTWTLLANPAKTAPALAEGTSEGLDNLFAFKATSITSPDTPVTLQAFLKTVEDEAATLIFTGHSLGGALSPTLALLLYPQPSASRWQNVHILPTAGPTPGNEGLANLFTQAYRPKPIPAYTPGGKQGGTALFTQWNSNYANVNDVVPRAWDHLNGVVIAAISKPFKIFYEGGIPLTPLAFGAATDGAVFLLRQRAGYQSGKTDYYAPAVPQVVFTGGWGHWADGSGYPPAWVSETLPAEINKDALVQYVLEAHLATYPFAFLGAKTPVGLNGEVGLFGALDVQVALEWPAQPELLADEQASAGAEQLSPTE